MRTREPACEDGADGERVLRCAYLAETKWKDDVLYGHHARVTRGNGADNAVVSSAWNIDEFDEASSPASIE